MKYPRIFNQISTDTQTTWQTEQKKQKVWIKKTNKRSCHSERSEESRIETWKRSFTFVQDDKRQAKKNYQAYDKNLSYLWQSFVEPVIKFCQACKNSWQNHNYKLKWICLTRIIGVSHRLHLHRTRIVALACVGFAECSLGLTQTTQNSQTCESLRSRLSACRVLTYRRHIRAIAMYASAKVCGVCVRQKTRWKNLAWNNEKLIIP